MIVGNAPKISVYSHLNSKKLGKTHTNDTSSEQISLILLLVFVFFIDGACALERLLFEIRSFAM